MKFYKVTRCIWDGMEGLDRKWVDYYFQNKENAEKFAKKYEEKDDTKLIIETIETED